MFFVKIATMFKPLVILFIITCPKFYAHCKLYTRNDILKLVRKKHGQNILEDVRKYKTVTIVKVQADIKFIKTCKSERLNPTIANVIKNSNKEWKTQTEIKTNSLNYENGVAVRI